LKTIGILGGTFDPVHSGHIRIAEQVQSQLVLDEVHFLPCANPVHRDLPQASDTDRVAMIELAIAGHPEFRLNTLELDRGGESYTIDSLRQIRAQSQLDRIFLILGVDAFNLFQSWKSPLEILQIVNLVVCRRPGIELDQSFYAGHRVDSIAVLGDRKSGCILALDIDENTCSSSHVKQQLLAGDHTQAASCLPETVLNFIVRNHLYE
jgi:nicotinate-nucleotide adenylyltransferase